MTTQLFIYVDDKWTEFPVYNAVSFDERLDEQLDSGEIQVITKGATPFDDFCMAKTVTKDGTSEKTAYFNAFDTVEKRGKGYYIRTLELVEPSRLLMGVMIDGRKVTQSIVEEEKKTLKTVLSELLLAYTMHLGTVADRRFYLSLDEEISELFNVISPEFHWEAQTLLWECLCDIGNVVNCIPRLTINKGAAAFDTIIFEKINDITAEYEM